MEEHWLPVPGWVGFYEVSTLGRVRSVDRVVERHRDGGGRSSGPARYAGRLLSLCSRTQGKYRYGHVSVGFAHAGVKSTQAVHRLVLLAFVGEPLPGQGCRHLNGDATDNRLSNLAWGTPTENAQDAVGHGSYRHDPACVARGERNGWSRLTASDVLEIRRAYAAGGVSQAALGVQFGVSQVCVSRLVRGKGWKHL